MVTKVNLVRVVYGKKDTPPSQREYIIKELGRPAVGTLAEIKEFLKNKGYTKPTLILHDNISSPSTKKKTLTKKSGWKSESARHALASKGIVTGRKSKGRIPRISQRNKNINQYIKDYRLGNLTLSKGGNSQDFVNRLIDYYEKKEGK